MDIVTIPNSSYKGNQYSSMIKSLNINSEADQIRHLVLVNQELVIENHELKNQIQLIISENQRITKILADRDIAFRDYILKVDTALSAANATIAELKLALKERDLRIVELERKLNMNSSNSSFPPSTDKKFDKKKSRADDDEDNNNGSGAGSKQLNLLEKLQQFAAEQTTRPKLTKRDITVLETLLLVREFQIGGICGSMRCTVEKLLLHNYDECNPAELERLLTTKEFAHAADYKRRGGQVGHTGSYLKQFDKPDKIKNLKPGVCGCGCKNIELQANRYEARQVVDILIKRIVTEYRLLYGTCGDCGETVKATSTVASNVSYSYIIRCYAVYMLDAHFMTYERLSQFFSDIFSLPLSEGSINNWRKEFARILGQGYLDKIREVLLAAKYVHADETTINVAGVKEWAHSVCNESATLLHVSSSRGKEGITASSVLDKFNGTLIVDGWSSYENLPRVKGIQACFAHLFRYFKDAHENYQQQWALTMLVFLNQFIEMTKSMHTSGVAKYSPKHRAMYYKSYERILRDGEKELSKFDFADDHRTWRLLRRLKKDKVDVLRFLDDTSLPLTNNMAERSVRPLKVKQKISGTMLSMQNAQENLDIKSFVATAKKQGQNILDAMRKLFQNPHDFEITAVI